jgi:CRISPR-associated protein Cas1
VALGFDFLGEHFDDQDLDQRVRSVLAERRPVVITEPYLMLAINGDALDVRRHAAILQTIPLRRVSELVILAKASFSTALIERCARHGIPISIALGSGYQIGTFKPDSRKFHEIAWQQTERYRAMSENDRSAVAAEIAAAKIMNSMHLLRGRYQAGDSSALHELESHVQAIRGLASTAAIRGHEGQAARRLFSWINRALGEGKKADFGSKRRDRGAPDRLNSMLNFGYYLLFTRINGLIRSHGLNPYLGFLHDSQDDYETLVADVQELFRVHVDRLVLRLINRGEITASDFCRRGEGMRLSKGGVRKYVEGFERLFAEVHGGIPLHEAIALQVANLRDFLVTGRPLRLYTWRSAGNEPVRHTGVSPDA